MELRAFNVNGMMREVIPWMLSNGIEMNSRNGWVLTIDEPVAMHFYEPNKRVLFSPTRDANPFFHLMEGLWMLYGDNKIEFPTYFNSKFLDYSDDGYTQHGAYGHRWRKHFKRDQIARTIKELKRTPYSRRCVITMWDPTDDQDTGYIDVPCNTHIYFRVTPCSCNPVGKLHMTVCNRSNDLIWGALGSNVVHMSMLHEYIATATGLALGTYTQFTNNLHVYLERHSKDYLRKLYDECSDDNYLDELSPTPLMSVPEDKWYQDLQFFMHTTRDLDLAHDNFFKTVAYPIFHAWRLRKNGEKAERVIQVLEHCTAPDWKKACIDWVTRRQR
jgi:thymidylate synthase